MLAGAGLEVIAQHGVCVFLDCRDEKDRILELILAAQPEFAGVARYSRWIARRPSVSQGKGARR
jgi:hypothetical protein